MSKHTIYVYLQILIFPSRDCTTIHGIFDHHVKIQAHVVTDRRVGTFLKHRLCEVEDKSGDGVNEATQRQYSLTDLPVKRAVFIDSTWNQSRSIYKDPRINRLRTAVLQHRLTQFWRHQKNSPRWYLATIEGQYLHIPICCACFMLTFVYV